MNKKFYYLIVVIMLLLPALACGVSTTRRPGEREEEAAPASKGAAVEPTREVAEDVQGVEVTRAREQEVEKAAATRVPEPEVVYTSDGNPCERPIVGTIKSATGRQPTHVTAIQAKAHMKLPHPNLDFAAFVPPAGNYLLTANSSPVGENKEIIVWSVDSGREITRLRREEGFAAFALSRERPLLAALTDSGEIWLWDLTELPAEGSQVINGVNTRSMVALSPDGSLAAARKTDLPTTDTGEVIRSLPSVSIFDVATGEEVQRLQGVPTRDENRVINGHGSAINWFGFTPDGQALLTLSWQDGTMRLWDIHDGRQLRCFELQQNYGASVASFSPDGREIATVSGSEIDIWDTMTSRIDRRFAMLDILDVKMGTVAFMPDGRHILTTSAGQQAAYIWNAENGTLERLLRHPAAVLDARSSPGGSNILTAMRNPEDATQAEAWVWSADQEGLKQAATAQELVINGLKEGADGEIGIMLAGFILANDFGPDDAVLLGPAVWNLAQEFGRSYGEEELVLEVKDDLQQ